MPIAGAGIIGKVAAWYHGAREWFSDARDAKQLRMEAQHARELLALTQQLRQLEVELRDKDAELAMLHEQVAAMQQPSAAGERYERNAVWFGDGYGSEAGPYCPTCWGKERRRVHMIVVQHSRNRLLAHCGACKTPAWVHDPGDVLPPSPVPPRRYSGWLRDY